MDQTLVFGKYDHLVGIENIIAGGSSIAMIMVTPGMLHNTGPFRMHVDIACSLEQQGISSFRFDISGIGESLGVGAAGKSIDRAASETIEAMDYLMQTHGIQQFILFGLCSGADDSMQAALQDSRVKGVITLDGLAYKTPKFWFNETLLMVRKMLNPAKLLRKLRELTGSGSAPASLAMGNDIREFAETAEQACKEIQQLVDNNVQLHFIYTGGTEYYNYARQFYDMLPNMKWRGTESTEYFSQMDHVVMLCEDRALLVDHVTDKAKGMSEQFNLKPA